jgi:hypothetical protein
MVSNSLIVQPSALYSLNNRKLREVFRDVSIKTVFWDGVPCGLVEVLTAYIIIETEGGSRNL